MTLTGWSAGVWANWSFSEGAISPAWAAAAKSATPARMMIKALGTGISFQEGLEL